MLCGCVSWVLTKDIESKIPRTQRRMLRMMLGSGRRRMTNVTNDSDSSDDVESLQNSDSHAGAGVSEVSDESDLLEPWVDWKKRVTRTVEAQLGRLGMENWINAQRRREFRWARRVVCLSADRWAFLTFFGSQTR